MQPWGSSSGAPLSSSLWTCERLFVIIYLRGGGDDNTHALFPLLFPGFWGISQGEALPPQKARSTQGGEEGSRVPCPMGSDPNPFSWELGRAEPRRCSRSCCRCREGGEHPAHLGQEQPRHLPAPPRCAQLWGGGDARTFLPAQVTPPFPGTLPPSPSPPRSKSRAAPPRLRQ